LYSQKIKRIGKMAGYVMGMFFITTDIHKGRLFIFTNPFSIPTARMEITP